MSQVYVPPFGHRCNEMAPTNGGGGGPIDIQFPEVMTTRNEAQTVRAGYDTANQGSFIPMLIEPIGLTESTITFSTATFRRSLDLAFSATLAGNPPVPAAATNYQYLLNSVERVAMTNDNGILLSEAVNTAFNEDYASFISPASGVIDQLICNFAVCLDVTVHAGSPNLLSVDLSLRSYANTGALDNTSPTGIIRILPNSAFTALAAAGTQILIVKTVINNLQYRVNSGQPVTLNITINETTGATTRNIGVLNLFPYLTTNQPKVFYTPEIVAHLRAIPDGANRITQFSEMKISGVST